MQKITWMEYSQFQLFATVSAVKLSHILNHSFKGKSRVRFLQASDHNISSTD